MKKMVNYKANVLLGLSDKEMEKILDSLMPAYVSVGNLRRDLNEGMDEIEAIINFTDTGVSADSILNLSDIGNTRLSSTKLCMKKAVLTLEALVRECEGHMVHCADLNEKERDQLKEDIEKFMAYSTYFFIYEIDVLDEEIEYTCFTYTAKKYEIDKDLLASDILNEFKVNRVVFGVIEDYPELWADITSKLDEDLVIDLYEIVGLIELIDLKNMHDGKVKIDKYYIENIKERSESFGF